VDLGNREVEKWKMENRKWERELKCKT